MIDDAIPEDNNVSKKTIPAVAPNNGNKVLYASDIEVHQDCEYGMQSRP